MIHLPHEFAPRNYQIPMLQARGMGYLREIYIWHRRAGKDLTAVNDVTKAATERIGTYNYFFPTATQARKVIWKGMTGGDPRHHPPIPGRRFLSYIPDELIAIGNKGFPKINSTEMSIELINGSIIQFIGTDDFDAARGTNCVGAVFSEYAHQDPRAWEVIEPILLENDGWAKFLYTPNGRNHGWNLWKFAQEDDDWFTMLRTIDHTIREDGSPVITLAQIESLRRRNVDEAFIQQEYYCSFDYGTAGAYYARLMNQAWQTQRIKNIPHDPALPVHTAWDVGIDDATAIIFFQKLPGEYHIINYYENSGEGIGHYAGILQQYRAELSYVYGNHYGPHDLKARVFSNDGKPQIAVAKEHGIIFQLVPRTDLQDGIEATRNFIPKCYFDRVKAALLIEHLENYSKSYNKTFNIWSETPRKDKHTHGADAMRMLGLAEKSDIVMRTSDYIKQQKDLLKYVIEHSDPFVGY
ncbi:MAG: hypothetical protein E3J83_03460 [Candidatus Atribacteria bacterium]|nr:MAG: hypothetical protein E3J83_03460 [Candidatus Atribacteria bacterium]